MTRRPPRPAPGRGHGTGSGTGTGGVPARTGDDPDTSVLVAFGGRLRGLRVAAGLTQDALARAAGMDRKSVNRAETGRHSPGVTALVGLAGALGVGPGVLLDDLVPGHPCPSPAPSAGDRPVVPAADRRPRGRPGAS